MSEKVDTLLDAYVVRRRREAIQIAEEKLYREVESVIYGLDNMQDERINIGKEISPECIARFADRVHLLLEQSDKDKHSYFVTEFDRPLPELVDERFA
jgi:hypothetical protein